MLAYTLQLLKDPSVASIAPTSKRSVLQILDSVDFAKVKLAVEYGPGDGPFTEVILERMRPDATLLVVETNPAFVAALRNKFGDPRLIIFEGSAEKVAEVVENYRLGCADFVISGIPFSFLPPDIKSAIARDTASILNPSGKFIVYQALTAIGAKYSLQKAFVPHFEIISHSLQLLNFPPLYVLEARPKKPYRVD